MEAKSLTKISRTVESIIDEIVKLNEQGHCKSFIPHWMYVSDAVKLELMKKGFKVSEGEFMRGDQGLIIEW